MTALSAWRAETRNAGFDSRFPCIAAKLGAGPVIGSALSVLQEL
jgi:hypothetical protein